VADPNELCREKATVLVPLPFCCTHVMLHHCMLRRGAPSREYPQSFFTIASAQFTVHSLTILQVGRTLNVGSLPMRSRVRPFSVKRANRTRASDVGPSQLSDRCLSRSLVARKHPPLPLPRSAVLLILLLCSTWSLIVSAQKQAASTDWSVTLTGGGLSGSGVSYSSQFADGTQTSITFDTGLTSPVSITGIELTYWMSGTGGETVGAPGGIGELAASNQPSSRTGAISWTGTDGHLYLFGG
jgi:hypothetical protein